MIRAVAVPESLRHLVPDPFARAPEHPPKAHTDFTFWNSAEVQHLELDTELEADSELASALAQLIANPPLEQSWEPANLREYIERLQQVVNGSQGFDALMAVWERDLAFPVEQSESWQKIMNSCVEEPFRKRIQGFRNPDEALLGLGPDKTLLADFNWQLVDSTLAALKTCCVGFLPPFDPMLSVIERLRETLWLAYELFLLSVSDRQLNRASCGRLARSFVAADDAGNIAPEQLVHDNPRTPAGKICHVRVIRKPPRDNDRGERGVLGRNREEKARAEVFDWYCRRAHRRFFSKTKASTGTRAVLAPVFTAEGAATGRSAPLCSVDDFALSISTSKWHTRALNVMLSNRGATLFNLANQADVRFPCLSSDRYMFSWTNGVFWIKPNTFSRHNERLDGPVPPVLAVNFYNQFFDAEEYDRVLRDARARLKEHPDGDLSVFAAYFILTPPVQKIWDQQQLPDEVKFFGYVMLGRMLYWLKDLDRWELWLYLQGKAGTGKSSLLNIIMHTYPQADVAIISNRTQRNFQIEHLQDALVYLCPDCSSDFGLDQAEWCKMVTGEKSNMAMKHKIAVGFEHRAGGAGAANKKLGFIDAGGNVSRRILVILFKHELGSTDVKLNEEMIEYHPAILKKINTCYLDTVKKHKDEDPWSFLPEYFLKNRREVEQETNSLSNFLCSRQRVELDRAKFTFEEAFQETYLAFCKARNLRAEVVDPLKCSYIFKGLGIVWAVQRSTGRSVLLGMALKGEPPCEVNLADFVVEHRSEYAEDFSGLGEEVLQYNPQAPRRYKTWDSGLPKIVRLRGDALRVGREGRMAEDFLREDCPAARSMRFPSGAPGPMPPAPAVPVPAPAPAPAALEKAPVDKRAATMQLMDNLRRNQAAQQTTQRTQQAQRTQRAQARAQARDAQANRQTQTTTSTSTSVSTSMNMNTNTSTSSSSSGRASSSSTAAAPTSFRFTAFGRMPVYDQHDN